MWKTSWQRKRFLSEVLRLWKKRGLGIAVILGHLMHSNGGPFTTSFYLNGPKSRGRKQLNNKLQIRFSLSCQFYIQTPPELMMLMMVILERNKSNVVDDEDPLFVFCRFADLDILFVDISFWSVLLFLYVVVWFLLLKKMWFIAVIIYIYIYIQRFFCNWLIFVSICCWVEEVEEERIYYCILYIFSVELRNLWQCFRYKLHSVTDLVLY